MRSTLVRQFGDPEQVIELVDAPRIDPTAGEVEIEIALAAINPSDLIPVTGAYRARTELPFVPGFEGVGTVSRIGPGVRHFKSGDRVIPIGASGLWQQFLVRPTEWCFRVPDDISDSQAAMSYVNPLTALRLIEDLRRHFGSLQGRSVAVTAAGSAIGGMLIKLIGREGAVPTAILRSDKSRGRFEAGQRVMVTEGSSLPPERVFDAVLDAVGGPLAGDLIRRAISPGGILVQYGALSNVPVPQSAIAARPDVRFAFLWLRNYVHSAGRGSLEAAFARCFTGLRDGLFASPVAATYPLSRLADALAHQADPHRDGKILIDPRC
ncbi:zinc-dependent alcohol dehydrogenase family protein [Sinorhizobium alkalisoli]|uniref:Oxidoreductase n=1 Tax=Sinorhizobium alkalisoli TaxID=1752398 RepID=A0A1E3V5V3_9HYPH|nr:zinc-dependent alcohol dehydrogenase family protein [Sinorhizobium alkalisoli]MCA1489583.1 zinc-dependent alcohol dehydrogenase family protein [Ensifer sp. NBAIM29]MCG5478395.1 zinc-dependent alcohol dehydrogenase family protein [Sinorhizobium alkalisoli]ODR88988.1 oxidoreductase [Sinorhizobium alkalisoli]